MHMHAYPCPAGKGWQGACARVAEDACQKLPRKLGGGWGASKRSGAQGGGGSSFRAGLGLLFMTTAVTGMLAVVGLHRRELAGMLTTYAGPEAAAAADQYVLEPVETGVAAALKAAQPLIEAATPAVASAWEAAAPTVAAAWEAAAPTVEPLLAKLQEAVESVKQQIQQHVKAA